MERGFVIDESIAERGMKIHLYWMIFSDFNNNPEYYDYTESVVKPQTELIRKSYTIENIKDQPVISAFRKFYWKYLKIDPTKIRPSGEALVRRILQGKRLPRINYFVDGYNWASAVSLIPIGAYDMDKFSGKITLRFAEPGERFLAIGGKERIMKGNELITVSDDGIILSQFPYRDADATKITESTRTIFADFLGVEGVPAEVLKKGADLTVEFLKKCKLPEKPSFKYTDPIYVSNF